jgi:hypothetical protein
VENLENGGIKKLLAFINQISSSATDNYNHSVCIKTVFEQVSAVWTQRYMATMFATLVTSFKCICIAVRSKPFKALHILQEEMFQDYTNATIHNDDYLKLLRKIIKKIYRLVHYVSSDLFLSLKVAFVHTFVLTATSRQKPVIVDSRVIVYMKKVIKICPG